MSSIVRKYFSILLLLLVCFNINTTYAKNKKKKSNTVANNKSIASKDSVTRKVVVFDLADNISTDKASNTDGIIWYAKQQLGVPYKYASADPAKGGLDCSGFLYYVFGHFKIKVPRTSKDYMTYGKSIEKNAAQKGDVIVFTGTDATKRVGGHVGIIIENNNGDISFIHSSSGKNKGVIISKLTDSYYTQRFLKIVRVVN